MKLKGINPIEKNVEKIVLGVVFVALLGALAMQFLVQPNTVPVSGSRSIPPQDIYVELASEAEVLRGKIEDQDPSLPDVPETDLQQRFAAGRSDRPSGGAQLAQVLASPVDVMENVEIDAAGPDTLDGPVMAPRVPSPTSVVAHTQWGTIDPFALSEQSGYVPHVPASQPYDLVSVSVEGVFSGTRLSELLASSDEGRRAIPGTWRRSVEIVGVALERQRLLEDGSWGASEASTPVPGGFDALAEVDVADVDLSTMLRVASEAGRNREAVVQGRFAGLIAGPVWEAPSRAKQVEAQMSATGSLPRLKLDLARAEQTLSELEGRQSAQSGQTREPRAGGGERSGGALGAGGGSRPSAGSSGARTSGIDRRIRESRDEIAELREKVDQAEQELEESRSQAGATLELPLFEQEELKLWAHDIGVRPGATYRYRIRAVINNPLYKKGSQLDESDEQQQSLAREALVHGAWSDWSEPVRVGDRTSYFVTNASKDSRLSRSGAQATVEVFHMYYGHYRSDRALLEPGDAVGVAVSVPEGFVLFETETMGADGMRRYITNQSQPGGVTPEGVTWAPTEMEVSVPAFLLDVSESPLTRENALGERETIRQVVIRTPEGRLEVRRPTEERADPAYAAARNSAIAGQVVDLRLPDQERVTRGGIRGGRGPLRNLGGEGEGRLKEGP